MVWELIIKRKVPDLLFYSSSGDRIKGLDLNSHKPHLDSTPGRICQEKLFTTSNLLTWELESV